MQYILFLALLPVENQRRRSVISVDSLWKSQNTRWNITISIEMNLSAWRFLLRIRNCTLGFCISKIQKFGNFLEFNSISFIPQWLTTDTKGSQPLLSKHALHKASSKSQNYINHLLKHILFGQSCSRSIRTAYNQHLCPNDQKLRWGSVGLRSPTEYMCMPNQL